MDIVIAIVVVGGFGYFLYKEYTKSKNKDRSGSSPKGDNTDNTDGFKS